jgi:hypothetical protein
VAVPVSEAAAQNGRAETVPETAEVTVMGIFRRLSRRCAGVIVLVMRIKAFLVRQVVEPDQAAGRAPAEVVSTGDPIEPVLQVAVEGVRFCPADRAIGDSLHRLFPQGCRVRDDGPWRERGFAGDGSAGR